MERSVGFWGLWDIAHIIAAFLANGWGRLGSVTLLPLCDGVTTRDRTIISYTSGWRRWYGRNTADTLGAEPSISLPGAAVLAGLGGDGLVVWYNLVRGT